jgi:beta-phosphoglucomutase-like phosphatase (HAD superfamily)
VSKPVLRALLLDLDGTLLTDWRPSPGAFELLDFAREHGLALAVVTSAGRHATDEALTRHGLRERFAAVVTAHDVEHTKPAPGPYLEALERLGVEANEAATIEDSETGVWSSTGAGVRTIVLDPGRFLVGLKRPRVIGRVSRLDEATELLQREFSVGPVGVRD